jgi:hypothetical protein
MVKGSRRCALKLPMRIEMGLVFPRFEGHKGHTEIRRRAACAEESMRWRAGSVSDRSMRERKPMRLRTSSIEKTQRTVPAAQPMRLKQLISRCTSDGKMLPTKPRIFQVFYANTSPSFFNFRASASSRVASRWPNQEEDCKALHTSTLVVAYCPPFASIRSPLGRNESGKPGNLIPPAFRPWLARRIANRSNFNRHRCLRRLFRRSHRPLKFDATCLAQPGLNGLSGVAPNYTGGYAQVLGSQQHGFRTTPRWTSFIQFFQIFVGIPPAVKVANANDS